MPKRGGRHPRGDVDHSPHDFNERDDRRDGTRRVSFKINKNKNNKAKGWKKMLSKIEDPDVELDQGYNNKGNYYAKGRKDGRMNSPAPRQGYQQRHVFKLIPGCAWYQVTIPFGQKHEKTFLLKTVSSMLGSDPFVPYHYHIQGNAVIFYVDDFPIAEKLSTMDKKVTLPDGYKLAIKVKPGSPHIAIDAAHIEKMELAMSYRYNATTKALDLTKFHADNHLVDFFSSIYRPSIMIKVIDIIVKNIPDLEAINLNDNKIQTINHFKNFTKLPNLKIMYLANNKIPNVQALDALKPLNLKEINLEGNPLVSQFKEEEQYVSFSRGLFEEHVLNVSREVQRKFPKLMKLDGKMLPPTIGFDVSDEINMPQSQPSFLCNLDGQAIVKQFLTQYYNIYDSASRQPLLDAYHENAIFSLSASYPPSQNQHYSNNNSSQRLHKYLQHSRNLTRTQDRDNSMKNMKVGRLQIVSFLNDLPKTQHDPTSFKVDLTLYTPTFLMLTVNGIFKEVVDQPANSKSSQVPFRAFHRTMIIVPYGSGFCVQNDMLYITNATSQQEQSFLKQATEPTPAPVQMAEPVPVAPTETSPEMRQQYIQALAMQTNMNISWSTDCLQQTNWDLHRAMLVFTQLHKDGKIPPEAFIK